jgi:hypothetical protein
VFERGPFYTTPKSVVHRLLRYMNRHDIMAFTTVSIAKTLRLRTSIIGTW